MAQSKQSFKTRIKNAISTISNAQSVDLNQNIEALNPKFHVFRNMGVNRDRAILNNSSTRVKPNRPGGFGGAGLDQTYNDLIYVSLVENKAERLAEWREIASFAEVGDALDEICNEFINEDDQGRIIDILWSRSCDLTGDQKDAISREFDNFIDSFELRTRGWSYIRRILIEGELYLEHIAHEDYVEEGIVGTMMINNELIEPIFADYRNNIMDSFLYTRYDLEKNTNMRHNAFEVEHEKVPFDKRQVTYVNSGIWDDNGRYPIAFIENARRAYRQLSLIEDSIVIYRLVRAPERLIFDVDVGNLSGPDSEQYLNKMIQKYWADKTFDPNQNDIVKKFKPQSQLDAFWFARREGSEGTKVTQLAGGANLGELTDLNYFKEKLYNSLRVPNNRLQKENTKKDGAEVLSAELKFAEFIIRMQQQFAAALKDSFFTHLKMKGMSSNDDYFLSTKDLDIKFTPPTNFHELRQQQRLQIKISNFNDFISHESISAIYGQIKYLKWSKGEIEDNIKHLKQEAALSFELEQIKGAGPNWKMAEAEVIGADGFEGGGGGGGPEFGDDSVPDFSGGEPDLGDDEIPDVGDEEIPDVGDEPIE
tara:strand:- start:11781 stop:13559 length:1779 start_codon:yes stop_codon:yes gene_type:complete